MFPFLVGSLKSIQFSQDHIDHCIDFRCRYWSQVDAESFNIKRFDYGVLSAYASVDLSALPTFDMLEDIYRRLGFRLGLDHLAQATLNRGKTAHGLQAVEWYRQGEMEKLIEYCRQDVMVTRDLFLYGLQKGHLVYREKISGRRVRLLVDWKLEEMVKMGQGAGGEGARA